MKCACGAEALKSLRLAGKPVCWACWQRGAETKKKPETVQVRSEKARLNQQLPGCE